MELNDYENGVVVNSILMEHAQKIRFTASVNGNSDLLKEADELESRAKKLLTKEQKEYLESFIMHLQKDTIFEVDKYDLNAINGMESELLQQVKFQVTNEDYLAFVLCGILDIKKSNYS